MLMQLVYINTRPEKKADRMLNFVLMRSAFCRGVSRDDPTTLVLLRRYKEYRFINI